MERIISFDSLFKANADFRDVGIHGFDIETDVITRDARSVKLKDSPKGEKEEEGIENEGYFQPMADAIKDCVDWICFFWDGHSWPIGFG
jgi:hypothetical protein